ncbi:MAG: SDR family oxidoreductase [Sedimentisphaerales bacterium]|nr:SDR family oxidoreductase [Sedimentisphaerales bacterium]
MKRKILITGGAGFIGSHLAEKLVDEGHSVIVLDSFITGSINNVRHLIGRDNFQIYRHDVTEPYSVEVDYIYNLACPASPIHYQRNPMKTLLTCIHGTINALDLAVKNKARLLHTSTSEIYGEPAEHSQREQSWGNVNSVGPRSCYAEGKRIAETLLVNYSKEYDVDIRIARIFNTYGPRMQVDDGRVVSNFITQALGNKPITIYGTGLQTRSFCFVSYLIEGLVGLMESDYSLPVNLGCPDERTIKEIAELIIQLVNSRSSIMYGPVPKEDPVRRKPDTSLAKKVLDWRPKINIEDGLHETIKYFQELWPAPVFCTSCYESISHIFSLS